MILIILAIHREDKARRQCLIEHGGGVKVVARMPGGLELGWYKSCQERSGGSKQRHPCKTSRRFSNFNETLYQTASMLRPVCVSWSERWVATKGHERGPGSPETSHPKISFRSMRPFSIQLRSTTNSDWETFDGNMDECWKRSWIERDRKSSVRWVTWPKPLHDTQSLKLFHEMVEYKLILWYYKQEIML